MTYLRFMVFAILFMCVESKSTFACQESVEGQDVNSSRAVQAEGIIITWSEANDEVRGFSQKLGDWEVLKIDPQKLNPQQKITPVVDSNIAAVRFGDSIAAFSGEKGWWDVVELSKNSTAVPVVSPSLAVFEDNGHLYTFSASKGQWSSPTDPELQPATFEYSFKREEVEDGRGQFEAWLKQRPQYEGRRISLDIRGGVPVLITTTRQSTMKVARHKLEEFWCPKKPVETEATPVPEPKLSSAEIDSQITKLREDLAKLESTVQAGTGQLSNPNVDQDQQTRELRKLVEQSFDLRQQLQELEAQRLRLKLQQVENNLAVRAKSRDAMVERRMEELRRPDSGNKVVPQEQDNQSTSRDNLVGSESIESRIRDVRIENEDSKTQWPQPGEIARQLRSFRESAISDMEAIRIKKGSVETWSQPLEKLIADGLFAPGTGEDARKDRMMDAKDRAAEYARRFNNVRHDWNYAWSAYQTQLKMLQQDVDEAKSKADSMAAQHARDSQLYATGNIAQEKLNEINVAFTASKVGLQRAEQMLKLYVDIETNEPELNPATLKGLDEIADNKEVSEITENEPGQNLPQQVIKMAEQLRKFRDAAVKLREERQPHENLITQYSRPLDQLKAEGVLGVDMTEEELKNQINRSRPEFDRLSRELDAATKAWRQAWNAYQSQSRLLELEVKHAENSLVSAEQTLAEIHAKRDQGLVGSQEVRDIEARRSAAVVQHEKSRELLHLWHELEKNEPELNPDWKPESSGKNVPE